MKRALLVFGLAVVLAAGVMVLAIADESRQERVCAGGGCEPIPNRSSTSRWRALAPATLERTEVAAARIRRSIYVVGGFERDSGQTVAALERYDIESNRWERRRALPIAVNHPTATAAGGRLYVHGGYRGRRDLSSATARLYVYLPRRDRWRRLPDSRTPRAAHAFAARGGRLYAAGGAGARGSLSSMEVYEIARRRWRPGAPLRGPARNHMTGVAAGRFFYALAGRGEGGNYRVAERYDTARRRWSLIAPLRKARGGIASAALSGGRVIVFGGEETAGTIAEVELFDPRSGRWRALPDMRTPRHGLGGVALRDRVYAIEGGPQPAFHFSNAIEFLDAR